ncbi:hypothetical protein BV22DRAFT_1040503 [Leucogyrophana mollusca]|uniref:Uncharacterized protein n=1 Tax=Leucogyrophana mollusca TaxID=85980 RepID=A0ACB8B3D5_9AGAM|nr:hypothetical protein BV22DRAFT_1040503 [Leucogyrophana mollusca]
MAPSRSASLTKKSKSDTSTMKQGTLGFASAKRTNSNISAKEKQQPIVTRRASSLVQKPKAESVVDQQAQESDPDVLEISSTEEYSPVPVVSARNTRTSAKAQAGKGSGKKVKQPEVSHEPEAVIQEREKLDVADKAGRYRKHFGEVRAKMGFMEPIHAENQNKIHQILRVFDMSYEYGPCVGMTRLERWERAESYGLNPPPEVRDILLTKEGIEQDEYAQCVLYGEV